MSDGVDELKFLVGSRTRVRILEELSATEELAKDELKRRLDCSRTTIQRNLDALEDRGLIRDTHPRYSLDPCGEYVVEGLLDLMETTRTVQRLRPFLKWVDSADLDIDVNCLADAELLTPADGDPYAMINRQVRKIKDSESGWALLPFTGLHATEAAHEQITENGAQYELVVEPDVAETHRTAPQYRELYEDLAGTDRYEMYVYDGSIPFALCRLDDTVQIVVAEGEEPRALLESDAPEVRNWAERTYEAYRAQATEIT